MAFPVVILGAVRSPFGSMQHGVSDVHAVELLAQTMQTALSQSGVAPTAIDHVVVGCATPVGEQAVNIARNAVVASNWPESMPAHTVDTQGTSGISAMRQAVALITSGMADICLVGAVSSERVPEGASTGVAVGKPYGPSIHERYAEDGGLCSPGLVAEELARRNGITRNELDAYAQKQQASFRAEKPGYLAPVVRSGARVVPVDTDEPRAKTTPKSLQPLFETDGLLTAATFARPVTGACALVLAREDSELTVTPLARVASMAECGADVLRGSDGTDTVTRALVGAGLTSVTDIECINVEEDTAVTPLVWAASMKVGIDEINRTTGALIHGNAYGVEGLALVVAHAHAVAAGAGLSLAVSAGAHSMSVATVLESTTS